MRYLQIGIWIGLYLLLLAGCTSDSLSGAGGQTTNGITASIVYSDGKIGANLPFRVRPTDYLTEINNLKVTPFQSILDGMTDSAGQLRVDSLDNGSYIIEVYDSKGFAVAFEHYTLDSGGNVSAGIDTLAQTGMVCGYMPPDELKSRSWYVQIYGLERVTSVDPQSGAFTFSDLPAGSFTFRLISSDSIAASLGICEVRSTGTTLVPAYVSWLYSTIITLNTTDSGANVQQNVSDFPVLVRLTSDNFNFSLAKVNGEDIRFSRADGSQLPYEIERWDSANQRAEIWVKIDTVYGNNDKQCFIMHWGAPSAESQSNSSAVFDTANGFAGVWHLSEKTGTNAVDATGNGFSGIYNGILPNSENTSIGTCQHIENPGSDYLDMGNVLNLGLQNISFGIWVKRSSFTTPQAIISKTDGDLPSSTYGYLLSIDPGNFPHFNMATSGAAWKDDGTFDFASNLAISDTTTWHYIFAVIDRSSNSNCRMYVDGIDRTGNINGNVTHVSDVRNTLRLCIGTENDKNDSYKGALREVTITSAVRSADWVKLSYMNQKEQDALVKW
jgi:hypothetical protein